MIEDKVISDKNLFFVPGSTPSSKNGKRFFGERLIASKATMDWRKSTEEFWKNNKHLFEEELKGIEKPYLIGTHFVRRTRHKFDWVKLIKSCIFV